MDNFEKFRTALTTDGIDFVATIEESGFATSDTNGYRTPVAGVIRISSRVQVAVVAQLARRFAQRLHPVSMGNNWGYGSALPADESTWILNLSACNEIRDYDRELGLVTLEPGVTFQQLYEYLAKQGDAHICPVHGAGPITSVLGNFLERGYGITPHADHFSSVQSLKAVLSDGTPYCSLLSALGLENLDAVHKWGIGPYTDGLFCQANLGIVTEITIRLKRRTECIDGYFIRIASAEALTSLIDGFRALQQDYQGVLTPIKVMDRPQMLSSFAAADIKLEDLQNPEIQETLAKKFNVPWSGIAGGIYGSSLVSKALRKEVRALCRRHKCQIRFFNQRTLTILQLLNALAYSFGIQRLHGFLDGVQSMLDMLSGKPISAALQMPLRTIDDVVPLEAGINPAKLECGLMWFAPLVPFTGQHLLKAYEVIERVCTNHDILALKTASSLGDTCMVITVPILFRRTAGSEQQARSCYHALVEELKPLGYFPYRLPINEMNHLATSKSDCMQLLKRIKNAFDPQHAISPGRYIEPDRK